MSVDIKGTVLVTGANGYIAGRVIEAFLLAGYHVRGTVRSASSVKALISALENYHNNFDVVEVPDITASGAFDEAVKGVDAVAHLAAPVSLSFDDPDPVIKAAVEGTTSILDSAIREPSIKSVLLMSSIATIIGIREEDYNYTEKDWNTWVEGLLQKLGKNAPGNVIYAAEKTLAEKAFWQFRDEKKPTFAMTSINPVFV
ncbi:putative nad dependent epimerase protein [Phaeoacremonium minimum UCRPA7]|uniref:Putative nad dependent epimerase protein n=1 Tax=Phaeoacremonium minimum (strain UCR-PA7) TaxID=1286976 RepID=R8BMG8_PHAM7|nr:putative nad dependent epimerase protein [Phaeoacremonium minimum UCRPA7]EOO00522.1 putative nad dependent epimerase protein [Phaeoacremonium minimum UCRPA7]